MRRVLAATAMTLLACGTAPAARLCRDTKGLFTPCIGERPLPASHPRHRRDEAMAPTPVAEAAPLTGSATPAQRTAAAPRRVAEKPPLVAKAHLCRDSKGLFTPCVR
jgi:hypothetical protein